MAETKLLSISSILKRILVRIHIIMISIIVCVGISFIGHVDQDVSYTINSHISLNEVGIGYKGKEVLKSIDSLVSDSFGYDIRYGISDERLLLTVDTDHDIESAVASMTKLTNQLKPILADMYRQNGVAKLNELNSLVDFYMEYSDFSDASLKTILNAKKQIEDITVILDGDISSSLNWGEPDVVVHKGSSLIRGCIKGAVIGFVLGAIIIIISCYCDKKVYLSEDINNTVVYGELVHSIPEYKDFNEFDNRDIDSIAVRIPESARKILVFDFCKDSGSTMIANHLIARNEYKDFVLADFSDSLLSGKNEAGVMMVGNSYEEHPNIIAQAKNSDCTIVVLRPGCIDRYALCRLDEVLNKLCCKHVLYVLNHAEKWDKDVCKYLKSSRYKNIRLHF